MIYLWFCGGGGITAARIYLVVYAERIIYSGDNMC